MSEAVLGAGPGSGGAAALDPAQKARLIYAAARNEMSDRLWRAALGTGEQGNAGGATGETGPSGAADRRALPLGLDALIGLLDPGAGADAIAQRVAALQARTQGTAPAPAPAPAPGIDADKHSGAPRGDGGSQASGGEPDTGALALGGPNARYAPIIGAAASRTGLPPAALATIVHAEAAKGADGRWLAYSRNPRSSAAGLGQFLSGTWQDEAERKGTWLHDAAQARGWLDGRGRVRGEARSELLALRYDPEAAIEATADYARANLDALARAGVRGNGSVDDTARNAYIGHHLGRGDAIRFLKGSLAPERARRLLDAQIGAAQAGRRIEAAGGAVAAHRGWLLDYVGRTVKASRFAA